MKSETRKERLEKLYDAGEWNQKASELLPVLKRYLEDAKTSEVALHKAIEWKTLPSEADEFLKKSKSDIQSLAHWFLESSRLLHSPHYMGHQVPPPIPAASLFAMMSTFTNQGGAVFEMGPSLAAVERAIIKRLGVKVGWESGFDGIVTNGGTLANLTALITARNHRYLDSWKKGIHKASRKTPVVLTSQDSHYSIARAAGVIGIGTENVIKIPVDGSRRVTTQALLETLKRCDEHEQEPFCIVAAAGSTPTGAFDDLIGLGTIANDKNVWFHVDGAHGASVLFSKAHGALVRGIALADSVTWDAHKMLFVPSLCTFLLFKNGKQSFETFKQDAPYLFAGKGLDGIEAMDAGLRTLECTRQPLAVPLWGVWSLYGEQIFEDLIDTTFENTRKFYGMIQITQDFKAVNDPQSNILCFRYLPERMKDTPLENVSEFQQQIKAKLLKTGKFYITGTTLDGVAALRVTLMHPFIEESHLQNLLNEIRRLGQ